MNLIFRLNEIRDSTVIHLNFFSSEFENFTKRDSEGIVGNFFFYFLKMNSF